MDNLYVKLAEILEVDDVKPTDVLRDFENWDSLTVLSILAMLDSTAGVNMTANDLSQFNSASELIEAVNSQKRK